MSRRPPWHRWDRQALRLLHFFGVLVFLFMLMLVVVYWDFFSDPDPFLP